MTTPHSIPAAVRASCACGPIRAIPRYHLRDDAEIHALPQMVRHAVEPVNPERTHGAGFLLRASVHELVNDQRFGWIRKQSGKAHLADGAVFVELCGSLLKNVVLDWRLDRQLAAERRHTLTLIPQRNLGLQQLRARSPVSLALAFQWAFHDV